METNRLSPDSKRDVSQKLILSDRKQLTVSGVTDVLRFDETLAVFETVYGRLSVRGEDLRVESLDTDAGDLILKGTVIAMGYSDEISSKSGVFSRIFR